MRSIAFYIFKNQYALFIKPKFLYREESILIIFSVIFFFVFISGSNAFIWLAIIILLITKAIIANKVKAGLLVLLQDQLKVFDHRYNLIFKAEYKEGSIYIKKGLLKFNGNNIELPIKYLSKNSRAKLLEFLDKVDTLQFQADR